MPALARNADGDQLLFVHQGRGDLFCDYGRLPFTAGDYLYMPRGTMWRLSPDTPAALLMIEATNGHYTLPDRGMLGPHAVFDPAMLDTPVMDDAFRAHQDQPGEVRVEIKKRGQVSVATFPYNPLDAVGWHGELAGAPQCARDPPGGQPPLPPATLGPHHLRRRPVRGLHLRATSVRDRSDRDQGALLSQQRRLRRGAVLSRR